MRRVAIVIPTWNRAELLGQALAGLARQTYPIERVVVVDDGSTDGSAGVAERAGAEVVRLGRNAGFAVAVNRGIESVHTSVNAARTSACATNIGTDQDISKSAGGTIEWIGILNNDVALEPDWLEKIMARLEASGAWFATGKLLDRNSRNRIDGTYDAICRGGCAWRCGNGRPDSEVWNEPRSIQFAPFTAAVFRADLFERVGLLDEDFESYLEDVEFGLRCAEQGLTGVYVPEAVAYHAGSATLGKWHKDTVRRVARNQLLMVAKHYPADWIKRYGWSVLIAQTLWGFVALRHGTFLGYVSGKIEGMRRFRAARGKPPARAAAVLEQSENEIRELQNLTGFDLYWRLYFALT